MLLKNGWLNIMVFDKVDLIDIEVVIERLKVKFNIYSNR